MDSPFVRRVTRAVAELGADDAASADAGRPVLFPILEISMAQTGLGAALRALRERRTLSLREMSQLSSVDHAYVHRLETGEKASPSEELIGKLLRVLKPNERDAEVVKWLAGHPEADPDLVVYVLNAPDVSIDVFAAAAGVRHRGNARPDPATLIARVKRAFEDDDD